MKMLYTVLLNILLIVVTTLPYNSFYCLINSRITITVVVRLFFICINMKNILLVIIILTFIVLINYLFELLFNKGIDIEIALIISYSYMLLDEIDRIGKLKR